MGMEVARDDSAGYAFVRQREEIENSEEEAWDDGSEAPLPRVLRRTRLSYHQMIILRRSLLQWKFYLLPLFHSQQQLYGPFQRSLCFSAEAIIWDAT